MICKFCGAELIPGTKFCVKCGNNNDEQISEASFTEESIPENTEKIQVRAKKSINLKLVLIPVLIVMVLAAAVVVLIVVPVVPKAAFESGSYSECMTVSFSASPILPFGKDPEIYLSKDGKGYSLYRGEEFYLNQVGTYNYDIYTVNGAGVKSSEKHYEYVMNVPRPDELKVSVNPGIYEDYQDVEIKSDDNSVIYYTTDGSEPDENSAVYDAAIHLTNGTTVIRAFAVNGEGTIGDTYEWTYDLRLPVPSAVTYSIASGVYYEPFELELTGDGDAVIYYTVDGSEPTIHSTVYSGPVLLGTGIHALKAMAVNDYEMSSEVTEARYAITLQKFGQYQRSAAADCYYGVVGSNSVLVRYDNQLNEQHRYDIYYVSSVYSDGTDIYYLLSNELYRLNKEDGSGSKIINMHVNNFALVHGCIYLESSGILYSMDLDGSNLKKFDHVSSCNIMGCWDHQLYYWDNGSVYRIASRDKEPEKIGETGGVKFFVDGNKIYYIDGSFNLICKNMEDDSSNVVMERSRQYYNLDPEFELFNTTDKSETITTTCRDIFVCNRTLYVLRQIDDEYSVYYLITQKTDRNVTTSYRWYAVDLETGIVSDTNITTLFITVFDNILIDGYEMRTQVIQ